MIFVLSPEDQDRLKEAKRLAVANPVPLDIVKRLAGMATEDAVGFIRGDRPANLPRPEEVDLSFGWRVNISCEEQPFGRCLHLSMSSPTPKKTIPRLEAGQMVLRALGGGDVLAAWIEEFKENGVFAGRAVNVLVAL